MARRGGRRGRRSRSRQNRSRRTSSRTRSRRTTTRRSAPSSRRNTRTTTRASNRRATVSKARRAAPKKAAPKKKAPTARRAAPSNRRATVSKARRPSAPKRTAPKKTTPTRTTQQRTNQRGVGAKKTSTPKKAVNASVGKPATSKRQATRINRKPPVKASTAFNNALKGIQNRNIASYDNRQFKSVPATGPRGDQPASDKYKEGMLQKNIKPGTPMNPLGLAFNAVMGINPAAAQGPMKPKLTREEQIKAAFPGASPNSPIFGMTDAQLSQPGGPFNQAGPGGPEKESDYTSYQPGSFYNQSDTNVNLTNALRSTRNLITSPARALGINNRLTNKLIPKSNEAIQDARDNRRPRPTLKRRGGSGGASRIAQQAAAQAIQPEIAPTIGTPTEGPLANLPFHGDTFGEGSGELNRIQNQAYNTQLTTNLSNMFGGQGSVGYVPQGDTALSPTLRAGRSRGRRRVRMFGARRRRGGTGDQFSRAGDRIAKLTNINI